MNQLLISAIVTVLPVLICFTPVAILMAIYMRRCAKLAGENARMRYKIECLERDIASFKKKLTSSEERATRNMFRI